MAVYKKTYRPYQGGLTASATRMFVLTRYAMEDLRRSKFLNTFYALSFAYPLISALLIYLAHNASANPPLNSWLPILRAVSRCCLRRRCRVIPRPPISSVLSGISLKLLTLNRVHPPQSALRIYHTARIGSSLGAAKRIIAPKNFQRQSIFDLNFVTNCHGKAMTKGIRIRDQKALRLRRCHPR